MTPSWLVSTASNDDADDADDANADGRDENCRRYCGEYLAVTFCSPPGLNGDSLGRNERPARLPDDGDLYDDVYDDL
jgi:hypothetical protein